MEDAEKKGEKGAKDAKAKKEEKKEEDLSEEDLALRANLELMVERLDDKEAGVQKLSLEVIRSEIRTSTSSMTSVPKPLKFLRSHYASLKTKFGTIAKANQTLLADVISVLAMTMGAEDSIESLEYRLLGSSDDIGSWGHEYVRNLAGEISKEFNRRTEAGEDLSALMKLVEEIVPFHVKHNAEPEAVDILLEVDRMDLLIQYMDKSNFNRTCLYLCSCSAYLAEPDDTMVLKTAFDIYTKVGKLPDAMRMALRMHDQALIEATFAAADDVTEKKQLAYLLGRQGVPLDLEDGPAAVADDSARETLAEIITNSKLSEYYLALARDLDVMEAKTPEDIFKTHLVEGRQASGAAVDSARQNLAATFVNAFVNAGFGHDKLMTKEAEGGEGSSNVSWIFKNKEHGKTSAAASLGMVVQWDVEGGLPQVDKYLYSTENHVVAGALLAVGIINTGVRNECDPAFALLHDSVNKDSDSVRIGAIMGLGLAYAGCHKEDVQELLVPVVVDDKASMEIAGFAALSLGLVFVGSAHQDCVQVILQALMMRPELELQEPLVRYMALGLGLLFLGKGDTVEATVEVVKTLHPKISKYCQVVLETCAYAGTGNVLKVQQLLSMCTEHIEKESGDVWADAHQGAAALGIALIAMGEELGAEMSQRSLEHLLQYGEPVTRRSVPLSLALLSLSNPDMTVIDTLSRLTHDTDVEVAQNAILAIGLVSAGTNNARVASMLRSLSSYYYKEPSALFLVRVAQGLVHLGKGLLTLQPYHTDRQLLNNVGLAAIMSVLTSCFDMKSTILGKHHYVLYYLAAAMQPRMLMTIDEEGKELPVPVRVGQAVDVVGQAGRPKSITGFQTHTTPVLLGVGDRAELATDKYIPCTPVLEGFVVLKPNPDYVEP
eukprot:CAMPEP_0182890528 /NCGR_PEP_ID=MMETSP0034_2-20130328/22707_1 /TAXON_ID=156128 /ORGANISM="Nephroselmis pyriformis, Strain CCMP717" /LENGTH=887 /DNA_ID=CAMNT_0025024083 /DNA_START=1 /DNA_END=2664 /DNA_ORIENTATION=-